MWPAPPRGEPAARFTCPLAPSANGIFPTAGGSNPGQRARRIKSGVYARWLHDAGWAVKLQKPGVVAGVVVILIEAPLHRRRDVDNAIKPTLDLLVNLAIIADDNLVDDLRIVRVTGGDHMIVSIWQIPAP